MDFAEYQSLAERTISAEMAPRERLLMTALGLVGEAAECSEQIKKHAFHGHALDSAALRKELGDVLWYAATLATTLGLSLEALAAENIDKLRRRYPEGFSCEASQHRDI